VTPEQPDIHELMRRVREHPDYVFGTIFTRKDFPNGEAPEDFEAHHAEDEIVARGNDYLFDHGIFGEDDT
jgi:hypothetical protein